MTKVILSYKYYLNIILQSQLVSWIHDAFKHHFTSLETDLIFLQLRALE